MQPLKDFPKNKLLNIQFVLTDIDETLTEDGRIPYKSLKAMEMLQKNNILKKLNRVSRMLKRKSRMLDLRLKI